MVSSAAGPAPGAGRIQCLYCNARGRAPCGGLRDIGDLEELDAAHNLPRRFPAGAELPIARDSAIGAYTILSGWVALADTLADGRMVIFRFALPGDVIPLEFQTDRTTRAAIAVGDVIICSFSRARHARLLREDPLYAERYHSAVAHELHLAYDHFVNAVVASATERVLDLLWELSVRSLRRRPTAEDRIPAPLTQIQIGLATGLTAVHVSRTLRALREQGLARLANRTIAILDPPAVERLCRTPEEAMAMWMGD